MIVKYESQEVDSANTQLYKIDAEVRFITRDGYKKIIFEHDMKALACMALIIEAREAGFMFLDLTEKD